MEHLSITRFTCDLQGALKCGRKLAEEEKEEESETLVLEAVPLRGRLKKPSEKT